jgi:hypothetical protein
MIPMALMLSFLSDPPATLAAVRLEAENDRPVVRAMLSAPVAARVERDGRDLFLVLPAAHPAAGLALPGPVAEIESVSIEDGRTAYACASGWRACCPIPSARTAPSSPS